MHTCYAFCSALNPFNLSTCQTDVAILYNCVYIIILHFIKCLFIFIPTYRLQSTIHLSSSQLGCFALLQRMIDICNIIGNSSMIDSHYH